MYAENNEITVVKTLPKNAEELITFYREHADGRSCRMHLRMQTHGDIDFDNCHPYEVFGEESGYPLYLMHNGVLHTGNARDVTKSDTWHYIQTYIIPALKADPTQFMSPWFKEFVAEHIGASNKFGLMDAYGNKTIINEGSGVMWDNVWMSNTYAWDAVKAGVKYAKSKTYWGGGYSAYGQHWDDDYYTIPYTNTSKDVVESEGEKYRNKIKSAKKFEWLAEDSPILKHEPKSFIETFDMVVDDHMMYLISTHVTEEELSAFYMYYGDDIAWELIDLIDYRQVTATEVLDILDDARSTIALNEEDEYSERKLVVGLQ
jgi:hypothetical protein